ncbi:MAG: hypothetical protein ACPGGA_01585 [Balneolaceae bacterium]
MKRPFFGHLLSTLFFILLAIFSSPLLAQNTDRGPVQIFDFAVAEELQAYDNLNLDATHANLLDPSASEQDINEVLASWSDFHQRIGQHLADNEFSWNIEADDIQVIHKVYFDPSGQVTNYFFRVISSQVSEETRNEYARLISDFIETERIDYTMSTQFAQCGKTRMAVN